jgi:hypothetical protein
MCRFSYSVGVTHLEACDGFPMISSVVSRSGGSVRKHRVAWLCGSVSTIRVFLLRAARLVARLTHVVVFPTPPFALMMAMIMG